MKFPIILSIVFAAGVLALPEPEPINGCTKRHGKATKCTSLVFDLVSCTASTRWPKAFILLDT